MEVSFALVDAFTDRPFAGNAAGIVTVADDLDTGQMQCIARELGQTETCFVAATEAPGNDFALRWFTPKVEVDLCGHATVAAFTCLAAEGRLTWSGSNSQVRCTTRTGTVPVWLERSPNGAPRVTLSVGVASLKPTDAGRQEVAEAIGLAEAALAAALPLATEPASARLVVPVARRADLLALTPNAAGMVAFGARHGYRRFTLVCGETEDPDCFVHLRHFAPANGIPEDPVTGTAHAVAAVYFDQQGLLPAGEQLVLRGEQGHAVGRNGSVDVDVRRQDGRLTDVRIGGKGTIVARGTIRVTW